MNIIYMHTHDTGRYISPYGFGIPTPNLMALAEEGILFRQMFSAAPTCSPSRVGLLTGMAPHSAGLLGLAHRGFRMNDSSQHLAAFLRGHGFDTALCGVQHEHPDIGEIGYDRDLMKGVPIPGSQDFVAADLTRARQAASYIGEQKDKPFFLSVGLVNTHRKKRDFPVDEPVNPNYVQLPFPIADTPQNREDMAQYISSAKVVDDCVGIVRHALQASGKEQDTLFIFTTDHGIPFPGMKCSLLDTGIGVSFLMKLPDGSRSGSVVDAMTSQIDLFPTLCDILGLEKPARLQGKSFLPLISGEVEHIHDAIYAEVTFHAAYEPMRAVRTQRYKYVKRFGGYTLPVLANMDDSLSKETLLSHGIKEAEVEQEQLFDLILDPAERVNRFGDSRYAAVQADLMKRLDSWMRETNDPLVAGEVPIPIGATVNKLSCVSPEEEDFE
ncbi:sulfatase family protein [Paenibacillus sp. strain BS8-2]